MNKAIIFLKTYLIFLFLLFSNSAFSQTICIVEDDADWRETRAKIINNIKDGPSDFKLVRVNIHFMLRTNGTGNFTETGDNLGNSLTGYHFANDIIDACNKSLSYNVKMAIPPNNTTSVEPKNYQYILDGVFFHRNDTVFNFPSGGTIFNQYGNNKDSVIHIIFSDKPSNTIAGYASSLAHSDKTKYTEIYGVYQRYSKYLNSMANGIPDAYSWVMHAAQRTINHELGHLFGLSHTVRYNHAPPCPTQSCQGTVNTDCDDGCGDTPSAWYIVDDLNGGHPACGWGGVVSSYCPNGQAGVASWCSNNMMDYGQAEALTPCQLNLIHSGLDGEMKSYTLCDAIKNDKIITQLEYPKIGYYGKKIAVNAGTGNSISLSGNAEANIYFSESVEFYPNLDISGQTNTPSYYNNKMEIIFGDICN